MSRLLFLILASFLLVSCGQDYNSNSNDGSTGASGIDCSSAAGARLCAAYNAFKANHCFQCHSGWSAYKTDAAWVGSGLVTAGNPTGSTLISRLKNSGGDMPQDNAPLSTVEYTAVRDWVQNL